VLTNKEKLTAQAQKYIERGQYDRAIREYLKVVAEDEKDVRTWLKIGDLFVKLGKRSEAAETYKKVARFYADQGFYLKAVAVYKQILKIDPRLIDVHIALAELFQQLGLQPDAIVQYEAVAAFLQREGRTREAIAAHQVILELAPDNVAQRIKLAELYSKEGLVQEAVREFSHTAQQLRAMGRIEDFLKVGERLLFHDPNNHAMAKELAALYLQRGDARRALTKLQVCFKADARDLLTLDLLAQAFLALGQHHKCASVLKELARLLGERGEREQATVAYQRVLMLDPGDADARSALSLSFTLPPEGGAQGAAEGAGPSGEARPAAAHAPPGPVPLAADEEVARTITEADVYAKYGLYQKSIEHLKRALLRQPGYRPIRERLCGLYEALGQTEEALAELWALFSLSATVEEEAAALSEILRLDPQNRTALHRWQEIRGGRLPRQVSVETPIAGPVSGGSAPPPGGQQGGEEVRSLRDELDLLSVAGEASENGPTYEVTRQGVRERGPDRTSSSSYFDLGVAYRDMGLFADAIAEFRKAMQDGRREVQCRTLIGECLLAQEQSADAIAEFKRALSVPGISDRQVLELYYQLGRSYEHLAQKEESLYFYEEALKRDLSFRDTRQRVELLKLQIEKG
jgi:tetratricopeptide (TPR) repeat protein